MKKNELNFEKALDGLESSVDALKKEEVTLEEAIKHFEEGIDYYNRCASILKEAKQKILLYDKAKEELQEF
ncbi:MAG: exodeoxyribonuclease VII small subunit [Eubacteriales bacterium]|nr:exodeoxyribonuclease VII small subunit [Eubacteriales bacterium]